MTVASGDDCEEARTAAPGRPRNALSVPWTSSMPTNDASVSIPQCPMTFTFLADIPSTRSSPASPGARAPKGRTLAF